jgi:predicted acetyltransferase
MAIEIRTPREDERDQIATSFSTSLNVPLERTRRNATRWPVDDFRCAFDGDRMVATAAEFRFRTWLGGKALATSGVFGVTTDPEYRGRGVMSRAVGAVMDEAHRRGDALTSLYPAVVRPYRSLGYELAGAFVQHRVELDAIPSDLGTDLPQVEPLELERDLTDVISCYTTWIRDVPGGVEPTGAAWWRNRVLNPERDDTFRAVIVRGADGIEGFAAFVREPTPGHLDVAFGLACGSFVALTDRARRALLTYFRGYRGVGRWLKWAGGPNDPTMFLLADHDLEQVWRYRWMLRILDVESAFAGRGYPAIDASAEFRVTDPRYSGNTGAWRLTLRDGQPAIERIGGAGAGALPVGVLSAMFTGFLRARDAARLGHLDPTDPSVDALTRILDGPDPWSPFFF